ncbi:LOW QUALITY PROTEIN: mobile element protein [Bacillus sp. JCM 19046]|nr:LOW QUALITY PROTEIN: mobile element protein [Bacillus sp. JCM 19046]
MTDFTTDIAQALVRKEDLQEVFRSHLEAAVNKLLATELTAFIDYEKYDRIGVNSGISRNGSYSRTLHTEFGDLKLTIPRDRNGDFHQQSVAPYKRSNETLESFVMHMYQKGVTTREIADLLERMYGHHYTPQTISNMTRTMETHVNAFKERPLAKRYVCIYLDATFIAVKRDTVKEAVYLVIGIQEDGSKEVLAYTIAPTESSFIWQEVLEDLRERGVEDVLLFISDGLKAIKDAIQYIYPSSRYQACCVHLSRNLAHKVRVSDRAEVCEDFKQVYRSSGKKEGQEALDVFVAKWKKAYPRAIKTLNRTSIFLHFMDFPKAIWRSIYSTNLIESFNKQLKKYSKRKEQFPNESSIDRFLVSQFEPYNQKFSTRCHLGFDQARAELLEMFDQLEA